jgi:hypothetical protein
MSLVTPFARARTLARLAAPAALLALAACHDNSDTTAPATPTTLSVVSGSAQTGTVGSALAGPVVLQVQDQSGKPISGVTVTWTAANGTTSSPESVSDSAGQVTTTWTLGTVAGAETLSASAAGVNAVTVLATATPGAPSSVVVTSGDAQSGAAGSALSAALGVKVTDAYGNPVPNVVVQWTDDAGGALATATSVTGADGVAQDALTLGAAAGVDDVTAAVPTSNGSVVAVLHETGT